MFQRFSAITRSNALYGLLAIFTLSLLLRIYFVFYGGQNFLEGDGKNYFAMINQLLDDNVYAYNSEQSNARVTPTFPLLFAALFQLFGVNLTLAKWVHILLGALTVFPVYYTIKPRTGPVWGLIAAAVVAVYPPFIYGAGLFLTETVFLLLLACIFWIWTKVEQNASHLRLIGCAFLLVAAILARPGALPIAAVMVLFLLWNRATRLKAVFFVLYVFAWFAPWTIRNIVVLHEFTLLASDSGNALLSGAYPFFKDQVNWKEMYALGLDQTSYGLRVIANGFKSDFWNYAAWFTYGKLVYLFKHMWISETMHFPRLYRMGAVLLHYGLICSALVTVPWKMWRKDMIAWSFAGMLAFQLLFIPTARYAVPFMMMAAMLLVIAASDMTRRYTQDKTSQVPIRPEINA